MPPKRGKSSQVEKVAAVPSPQRANSRRKQAPQPEEEVVSQKPATSRRSRGVKLKEEPVQEILQPPSAKKTEKPKGRTTRASQLSLAEDEPKPQAKGTPKKTLTPKRNSRQKKIVEPSDSDNEGETVLPLSSPKIAKQSKKSNKNAEKEDVASMKYENTTEAPEISEKLRGRQFRGKFQAHEGDICQDASYILEEDSAKVSETAVAAVKASPVKRGRRSRGQFHKKIDSREEDNQNEAAVDEKVDAGTERDIAGEKVKFEEDIIENPMKSDDKQENVSSKRGPPKRGKRATRATNISKSEEMMGFDVENKSLAEVDDPEEIRADVEMTQKEICESEGIVSQEQGSDKHTLRNICDEAVETPVITKNEREVPCKETSEARDIKDQVITRIKSDDEVDNGTVEEDVIMKEEEANEINKDGEDHTSKVDVFDASGDETKVEEGETDGDSVSTGSLEKCSKGGDSSEGFEGFEIDNSQKGEIVSLREITLRQQLDLPVEQVISKSKKKNRRASRGS